MIRIRCFLLHVALAAMGMLPLAAAAAAESNLVATDHDTASLVSETDGFAAGQDLKLGLRLRLAPGWHTYWSNPGDAGEAATIAITATGAAVGKAGSIDWPAPLRLPDGPLMSYGYTGDVVLPVTLALTGPRPGAGTAGPDGILHLSATADWLACANVCVPEHGEFRLDLPQGQGAAKPSAQAPLFAAAQARHPLPSPFAATLMPAGSSGETLALSGTGLGPQAVRDAWFFPAAPGVIDQVAAQKVSITPGQVSIALKSLAGIAPPLHLEGLVVLRDAAGNESYLGIGTPRGGVGAMPSLPAASSSNTISSNKAASSVPGWSALPRLMLLALLGGIVLNLMPCVFPVLAMKALALSRMSGAARSDMRLSAGFYTGGVLVAFAGLGGLMLGLRAAGSAVGWGFQFQSPIFVAGTCWLLFVVGLNLAGLFEIGTGVAGLGQGLTARKGHGGDFATGLLAVLVASPCTAPFMGVAIAGALSAPAAIGMAVFLAMGVGLALPYVLLALVPGLAARLPRPGNWMLVLRQALSFPVFASCAWLAWVTAIEGGSYGILVLASGMVLLSLAGWLLGLPQRSLSQWSGRVRIGCLTGAALMVLAAIALLPGLMVAQEADPAAAQTSKSARAPGNPGVETFSNARLAALRAEGRPVFIDMTAAWCVTCLVNERIALSNSSVHAAFAAHHVAYLKGDWTNRNAAITDFLRAHGRDGVPLYVYYPAGAAKGRLLPQILTADRVLNEVNGTS